MHIVKPMYDGEKRLIKSFKGGGSTEPFLQVFAYRIDEDTPYIIIQRYDQEVWLEDCMAEDGIKAIQSALRILPSSK